MPSNKTRVLVLFGGRSSEHEISIKSAASILQALDSNRFVAIPQAIERSGRWLDAARSAALLPDAAAARCELADATVAHQPGASSGFDVVFPVLHGPYGEDGRLQGLLDLAQVPYVGSGVLGSACGMDKDVMKRLFRASGLATLPHVAVWQGQGPDRCAEIERRIPYPAFVKPANLGSSVGIRRVQNRAELLDAIRYAGEFDRKIIVEPGVDAREIECAVLGNEPPQASLPGEIIAAGGFYDYEAKYVTDEVELVTTAELEPEQVAKVRTMAVQAFEAVGCADLARVDFFIERSTGSILLNEVNTMPGFTSISMYPKMWEASGVPYPALIERLIECAFARHAELEGLRFDRQ